MISNTKYDPYDSKESPEEDSVWNLNHKISQNHFKIKVLLSSLKVIEDKLTVIQNLDDMNDMYSHTEDVIDDIQKHIEYCKKIQDKLTLVINCSKIKEVLK